MAKKLFDYESNTFVEAPPELDPAALEAIAKELSGFLAAVGIENEISPEEVTSPEGKAALEAVRDMLEEARAAIDIPDELAIDPTDVSTQTAGILRMAAKNKMLIRFLKEGGGESSNPPVAEAREKGPAPKAEMTDDEIEQLMMSRMGGV